ncbi:MAG: 2-oxoacid:acceptor oxidoreductase family protein [Atribacterota bacterium]|nr:2-oxoacid:acceptor oxidoreductase family protein [Atribacterota bacterium]
MEHHEILIGGFGGQGILFLGRVLATAGMVEGHEVSWFPSYGPEMRGGTANCTVIISDEKIGATITDHPQVLVAMNTPSFFRFAPLVQQNGLIVINSSLVSECSVSSGVEILEVPANELAGKEVNAPETTNIVMLGALLAFRPVVRFESVEEALKVILKGKKEVFLQLNLKALQVGRHFVEKGGKIYAR